MKKVNLALCSSMLALSTLILLLLSCTKDSLKPSAVVTTSASEIKGSKQSELAYLSTVSVSPGIYKVYKFIEKGKDETAQFKGYTFKFQSDGVLIATTSSGQVVKGKWRLYNTHTKMLIDISGTEGLNDIDDDEWKVEALSSTTIKLSLKDPVIIEFVKI